jgi:uncharacterized protein (DUF3820 family)
MENKQSRGYVTTVFLLTFLVIYSFSLANAQDFNLVSASLNCGGGQVSSGDFVLQCSMGQTTPVGMTEGGGYCLYAGFVPAAVFCLSRKCIDFESPLQVGTMYHVGDSLESDGVTMHVKMFQVSPDQWVSDGDAEIVKAGCTCDTTQEMRLHNVNLDFDFDDPWPGLSLSFGEYDGILNIKINGIFQAFENFDDIDGTFIGGTVAEVSGDGSGSGCGTLTLVGTVNSLFIGGQNFCIDHVCCPLFGMHIERGDCNSDGVINVLDVLAVINHILGTVPITDPYALVRADCNCNGVVNIVDAVGIVNVILGIGECKPGRCKAELTDQTLQFFKALESHFPEGEFERLMALVKPEAKIPTGYSLAQNYPNPFNPTTSIQYSVIRDQSPPHVTLKIYNLLGQEVRTLVNEIQEPGYYIVTWDSKDNEGRQAASGVYFYRLTAGNFTATKRMVLMK